MVLPGPNAARPGNCYRAHMDRTDNDGRRLKFTVGPKANAEFALAYAQRNSHKLQFEQLAFSTEIVSVEAGEESTRLHKCKPK